MNKNRSRQVVNTLSKSNVIKLFVTTMLGVVFLITMPIVIVFAPFVYAWHFVNAVFEKQNKVENFTLFHNPSRWGSFEVDFSSWKNHAEGEW